MPLIWNDAIYDRTEQDVARVKYLTKQYLNGSITQAEKVEYADDLKGALNRSDLERIINNIELLNEVLELSLDVPTIPPHYPADTDFYEDLLDCVATIRASYAIHADTPQTPSQPLNLYTKWNDIEKILFDIYDILNTQFVYYSIDEIYCGDTFGLLL